MRAGRFLWAVAAATAAVAVSAPLAAGQKAAPAADPLAPATSGGLELVDRALAKLSTHRRLMVVGAHPDDEDNALLTWVGRGLGGEAAYLSLSRGEGGQNLIGTELGVGLGVIRTGELEAARRIEGTRQYFARAYDFGYTRSLDETLERWPREVLLEDAMRALRRFKPQVLVSVFPADARAGHGQHQAAGMIAREAFAAAREGREFPALEAEGLEPWRPAALFQRAWSLEQVTAGFDLGTLEPVSGRTLAQIAAASRSSHRSQDMGREQRIGRLRGGVVWEAGAGEGGTDPFAGIDTELAAIAELLGESPHAEPVAAALRRVAERARATRQSLHPAGLAETVGPLAEIVGDLDQAIGRLSERSDAERVAGDLIQEKRGIAARALAAAAGVMIDAVADRERLVPGESLEVTLELWPSVPAVVESRGVTLAGPLAPAGQTAGADRAERSERTAVDSWKLEVEIGSETDPSLPYYLRRPRRGDLYDWSEVAAAERGEPRQPPPLTAIFDLTIAGAPVRLEREVVYRYGDQALGEVRRPLRVVPALELEVEPELVLWNRMTDDRKVLRAVLRSNASRPLVGELRLRLPPGWQSATEGRAASTRFELDAGQERAILISVSVPGDAEEGRPELGLEAVVDGGTAASLALPTLEYPHIVPTPVPRASSVAVAVFDLNRPRLERIGYVIGASDRVPGVLAALGLPVEILSAEELLRGDLSGYDAVVVGSRAYEIDPALAAANQRLLDYARRGGTVIVQYQQYQFVRGEYAPFPLSIDRPHGRVTDETAAIEVLAAEHPVFHHPNQIAAADWSGWVQERGLYFAAEWDERYQPLLALADEGREPEKGALLVAPVGEGVWVYTGLSFFRQLPAGVPGAMRLFVNLLALGGG